MKHILLAAFFLPCLLAAQVHTKIIYTLPPGSPSDITIYSSEKDEAVYKGHAAAGRHTIFVQTKAAAAGFIYVAATRQSLSVKLNGKAINITPLLKFPAPGDEEFGASMEIFPGIDKNFLAVTAAMQNLSAMPVVITDTAQAKEKARQYYATLQRLIVFTDSIVTLYPKNNVALFTVFRLGRWCAYSPEVYTMLSKLDTSLLNNDFARDLVAKQQKLLKDSMAVAGKKTGGILQKAVSSAKLAGTGARQRLIIYWDDFSRPDREITDDVKRLHLVFGSDALQINFVYTGSSENWQSIAKQAGLPAFANYLRCSKPDQTGTSPVVTASDNTCLIAGIRGYNLYRKISSGGQ